MGKYGFKPSSPYDPQGSTEVGMDAEGQETIFSVWLNIASLTLIGTRDLPSTLHNYFLNFFS